MVALIGAARLPGPFVFVARSFGGLILDLAGAHPSGSGGGSGDGQPASEFLIWLGSPAQNAAFEHDEHDSAGTR